MLIIFRIFEYEDKDRFASIKGQNTTLLGRSCDNSLSLSNDYHFDLSDRKSKAYLIC